MTASICMASSLSDNILKMVLETLIMS